MQDRSNNNNREHPENEMSLEFPSLPANVQFARMAVAIFASQLDFTVDQIEEIKVAISEAVSNAVIHGYQNAPGPVHINALLYLDRLQITVSDNGTGIDDVSWALQPAHTTDVNRMGLGLVFMQEYMDNLCLDSALGQGTRVSMTKMLAPRQEH
jgi:stage II sporulation protein AB (anti-sigma F factor)